MRIEEMFVGAYVMEYPREGAMVPMRVSGICPGGIVMLGDASSSMDVVSAIPIDGDLLRGMGFARAYATDVWVMMVRDIRLTVSLRQRHGAVNCRRVAVTGRVTCWSEDIRYLHELQRWWVDRVLLPYGVPLDLEWNPDAAGAEREEP